MNIASKEYWLSLEPGDLLQGGGHLADQSNSDVLSKTHTLEVQIRPRNSAVVEWWSGALLDEGGSAKIIWVPTQR